MTLMLQRPVPHLVLAQQQRRRLVRKANNVVQIDGS